jgi:hypothetical protein
LGREVEFGGKLEQNQRSGHLEAGKEGTGIGDKNGMNIERELVEMDSPT